MMDAAGAGAGSIAPTVGAATAAEGGGGGKDDWAVTALLEFLGGGAAVRASGQDHSLQSRLLSVPPGFNSGAEFPPPNMNDVSVHCS